MSIKIDRILRLPAVIAARGTSRSSHRRDIEQGTYTPPLRLGVQCIGWPESEVDALNRARVAGRSAAELRELVAQLVQKRAKADIGTTRRGKRAYKPEAA